MMSEDKTSLPRVTFDSKRLYDRFTCLAKKTETNNKPKVIVEIGRAHV